MNSRFTRRQFLKTTSAAAGWVLGPEWSRAGGRDASSQRFAFVLLGDLHFDRLEHHDMDWVQKEKPGGYIHKFNTSFRRAGGGRFAQFALSSVLGSPTVKPKDQLFEVAAYSPDQIGVEPRFSPANEAERRAVYDAERTFVDAFEYADIPGYAVVIVDGANMSARMYAGASRELWRQVDLSTLARA